MSVFDEKGGGKENLEAIESYVAKLVEEKGENWKDPETIAKGKLEADRFIEDLKRQNEELRKDLDAQQKIDQLLELVKSQTKSHEEGAGSIPPGTKADDTRPGGPSEDDLKALVEKFVAGREASSQREKNLATVDAEMDRKFGDSAGTVLRRKAAELDMTMDEVKELAANKPKAFFRLMELDATEPTRGQRITQGTALKSEASQFNRGQVRDWNYYQDLRRKNKTQYFSQETQKQMMRDRAALGDKFGMPS